MRMKNKYPECEKLQAVHEESQKIGQFLDWLTGERGIYFCKFYTLEELLEYDPGIDYREEDAGFIRDYTPIQSLLAEYFEIDMDKVEEERRQILEELRRANNE